MKPIRSPEMAKQKILNALRHLDMDTNPIYKAKRNLFVGRYKEKEELESALISLISSSDNSLAETTLLAP